MSAEENEAKNEFSAGVAVKPAQTREEKPPTLSEQWTNLINGVRAPIHRTILSISDHAAAHPWAYVVSVIAISLILVVTGLFTNFSIDVDEDTLWTPLNSRPLEHSSWISDDSGFNKDPRNFIALVHRSGKTVLGLEGIRRAFDAIDIIRNTENYDELCSKVDHVDFNGDQTCPLLGVTSFWNDTESLYESSVSTDKEAIDAVSSQTFPNGSPVDIKAIMGNAIRGDDDILISVDSYFLKIQLPEEYASAEFEKKALDDLLDLRDAWAAEAGNDFVLSIFADRSFSDEFTRGIVNDIPLVPIVFVLMSVFTCCVFWRKDSVFSRTLLGLGAVCTVFLAIMTGYGIMFCAGVPFTSMTQILPFIMFGIGLDNAYIMFSEYSRTDSALSSAERVHEVIDEVGLSIFLTTITSVVAFALGCISTIPAILWLCMYAAPTIFINFIYQLTFFVALMVIDDRRVKDKRRDCLVCVTVKSRVGTEEVENAARENWLDRYMGWYADALFNPFVSAFVLVTFTTLLAGCAYSSSKLTQDFQFSDVLPSDSYAADFWDDVYEYSAGNVTVPQVYFRFVDQCDASVQQQMQDYIEDLVGLDQVPEEPPFFWLRNFQTFVAATESVQDLSCREQVGAFLDDPVYYAIHHKDIARNEDGDITSSRAFIRFELDQNSVTEQIDTLEDQRAVSAAQPVNEGRNEWAFFTFEGIYFVWEFYSVVIRELAQTTIAGVFAVSFLAFALIPHWTAVLFVSPMICILYVDLLGVLQFAGFHINSVSYIALVMSIGLLVDFLMHILLRYYESELDGRKAKVKDTLKTMGSSILIGAVSTFLGVIPLAFSSSEIFRTLFVTFVGLVVLGAAHGLILFPVLLGLFGPNVCIKQRQEKENQERKESSKMLDPETKSLDVSEMLDPDTNGLGVSKNPGIEISEKALRDTEYDA